MQLSTSPNPTSSGALIPLLSGPLAQWGMLTIAEIRLRNLESLVDRYGSVSALVAAAAERGVDIHPVYVSQIRNQTPARRKDGTIGPPRGMGDEQARAFEKGLALERGWMDNVHTAPDALAQQLLDLYDGLSIEGRHEILLKANERHNYEHPRQQPSRANPFPGIPVGSR